MSHRAYFLGGPNNETVRTMPCEPHEIICIKMVEASDGFPAGGMRFQQSFSDLSDVPLSYHIYRHSDRRIANEPDTHVYYYEPRDVVVFETATLKPEIAGILKKAGCIA